MDVEEQPQNSSNVNSNSSKRFGLKNSIQTNFGDDYVFQIVPKYASFVFQLNSPLVSVCFLRKFGKRSKI
jgi:hypothetical protein